MNFYPTLIRAKLFSCRNIAIDDRFNPTLTTRFIVVSVSPH